MSYTKKNIPTLPIVQSNSKQKNNNFLDSRVITSVQLKQQAMMKSNTIQRAVSVSGLQYIPSPADLVFINTLDGQVAAAEVAASNDVQNNPAPLLHTQHQAAYMQNPNPAAWGNCVEEKLNIWAINNGWTTQNNSGGSNPDYSRMNGPTKIWADLTTAAEAGAGASHITDKLTTKVNSNEDDTGWVAADIVHQGLNPLAGGPPVPVATNGLVTQAQKNAWQLVKTYQARDAFFDDLTQKRIDAAGALPSYSTYTQVWNHANREQYKSWIDGSNDANLPDDYQSDYDMSDSDD